MTAMTTERMKGRRKGEDGGEGQRCTEERARRAASVAAAATSYSQSYEVVGRV